MLWKAKFAVCSEYRKEHKFHVIKMYSLWMLNLVVRKVIGSFKRLMKAYIRHGRSWLVQSEILRRATLGERITDRRQ